MRLASHVTYIFGQNLTAFWRTTPNLFILAPLPSFLRQLIKVE